MAQTNGKGIQADAAGTAGQLAFGPVLGGEARFPGHERSCAHSLMIASALEGPCRSSSLAGIRPHYGAHSGKEED